MDITLGKRPVKTVVDLANRKESSFSLKDESPELRYKKQIDLKEFYVSGSIVSLHKPSEMY